jgi:hypothetical protein
MDFFEQLLHISPDGGSGVAEFALVTLAVMVVGSLMLKALGWKAPRSLAEFLEWFGRRDDQDRFDR